MLVDSEKQNWGGGGGTFIFPGKERLLQVLGRSSEWASTLFCSQTASLSARVEIASHSGRTYRMLKSGTVVEK